jgi:hypothetical protein
MIRKLQVGDRIELTGGADIEPDWLHGASVAQATVLRFIPGAATKFAAVVVLHQLHSALDAAADFAVLSLCLHRAKWHDRNLVDVVLCRDAPRFTAKTVLRNSPAMTRAAYRILDADDRPGRVQYWPEPGSLQP